MWHPDFASYALGAGMAYLTVIVGWVLIETLVNRRKP